MPSPFPGMDPYLEDGEIFPDFHDRFIIHLSEFLQPQLPEPYYAGIGRRAWIEVSERYIGPDVEVGRQEGGRDSGERSGAATAVVVDRVTEPVVIHVPHDERVEPFVEVYHGRGSERRLVTSIEMLKPENKDTRKQARELYLMKQREVLESKVHLIEIDLLRGGGHTTAVPLHRLRRVVSQYDYHVCVHRFDNFEDYYVYPILLRQQLPIIKVPLLPGDGEVRLDLQEVFVRTYESGPYSREIDYSLPVPPPELQPETKQWVEQQIKRAMTKGGGS